MNEWRRVAAALARKDRREAYARLILGLPVDDQRAVRDLTAAGLVDSTGVVDGIFADLLAQNAPEVRTGTDRFIVDDRIAQYPARPADRAEVLEWAAGRVLGREPIDEATLTERLAELVDDPVSLRRYLVDADLVKRSPDGSSYWLDH